MRLSAVKGFALVTLAAVLALAAEAPHPQLAEVHKVYMMPMGGGLDQYLANQLTAKGVFEVVTDAKLADAVFSESIGADFETRLKELLPPPPPPPPVEPPPAEPGTKKSRDKQPDSGALSAMASVAPRVNTSSFSRGRGNLFLVDLASRAVIWSTHSVPKYRTPDELDRTAGRMVETLIHDNGRK